MSNEELLFIVIGASFIIAVCFASHLEGKKTDRLISRIRKLKK